MPVDENFPLEDQEQQPPMSPEQQELAQAMQYMQETMLRCATGQKVMAASDAMMQTGKMYELMQVMEDLNVPEQIRMLMGQYMGQMMNQDPENGLLGFADYLQNISNDPQQAPLKDYYLRIRTAALALSSENEYKDYIIACRAFDQDKTPDAETARKAGVELQMKIQKMSGIGQQGEGALN